MGYRTGVVTACTSLLLGLVFCHWLVDFGVLWVSPIKEESHTIALKYYQDFAHSPVWLAYGITATAALAVLSLLSKLCSFSTSSILFDGGSLILYMAAGSAYFSSVREGLFKFLDVTLQPNSNTLETLRKLASAHLTISVGLTGVIALQAGQYFAERQIEQETGFADDDGRPATGPASPRTSRPASEILKAAPTARTRQQLAGATVSRSSEKTQVELPTRTTQVEPRMTRAASAKLAQSQQEPVQASTSALPAPVQPAKRTRKPTVKLEPESDTLTVAPPGKTPNKRGRKKKSPSVAS